jgi:hypothetical protein
MACVASEGLVNFFSLVGAYPYAHIASLTASITAWVVHRLKLNLKAVGQGFRFLGV